MRETDLDAELRVGTIEEYKAFKVSHVGQDYDATLRARLEEARFLMETETEHVELLKLQGSIAELKLLIGLPDRMISDIEHDNAKQEEPSDRGEEDTGTGA